MIDRVKVAIKNRCVASCCVFLAAQNNKNHRKVQSVMKQAFVILVQVFGSSGSAPLTP